ncbi:TilS substrate-binding domain-containing protein [Streptomyces venezuelae]|uniref:TilS substrate-binding domain-containing protein n=1 Tax=Streptomyces venezuelae TaxID=54571 RepID=UPI00331F120B
MPPCDSSSSTDAPTPWQRSVLLAALAASGPPDPPSRRVQRLPRLLAAFVCDLGPMRRVTGGGPYPPPRPGSHHQATHTKRSVPLDGSAVTAEDEGL